MKALGFVLGDNHRKCSVLCWCHRGILLGVSIKSNSKEIKLLDCAKLFIPNIKQLLVSRDYYNLVLTSYLAANTNGLFSLCIPSMHKLNKPFVLDGGQKKEIN